MRYPYIVIAITLILGAAVSPAAEPGDSQSTAAQLQQIVKQLNALDSWFDESERQRAVWQSELQHADQQIDKLNQAVNRIRQQVRQTEAELDQLRARQQTLQQTRRTQAALIAEHVSAAYRLTGQDFFKQLLNQQSPDEFERMIRYHRYFSESRSEVLKQYQETLSALASTDQSLQAQQVKQQSQQQNLQAEQDTLQAGRSDRAGLIADLDAETRSKTQVYEQLRRDRKRLESLLIELRQRASELDGSAFEGARGQLPMPLEGRIRNAFGGRRAEGRLRWHGIDIAADDGAPVTAVYRGRVIFADWLRGFGLLTILDHGSDYMTLYGHADALYKKVGDEVESGEVIAGAGNSGGMTNSGIYFEVRHKGIPQDPISWIRR